MGSLATALDLRSLGILVAGIGVFLTLFLCIAGSMAAAQLASAPQVPNGLLSSDYFGPKIEPIRSSEAQTTCDPTTKPGVEAFRDAVLKAYPQTGHGGISRECSADGGATSEHKEGRAWDWMVNSFNPEQKAIADNLLAWLLEKDKYGNEYAMARRLGIMYIVWNHKIWSQSRSSEGWRNYSGTPNPHTDHVHFSFYWTGALQQTTYWHPQASCNPPATTPPTPLSACGGPAPTPTPPLE